MKNLLKKAAIVAFAASASLTAPTAMAACGENETPVYRVEMVAVWTGVGWVAVPRVTIAYCALK